MQLQCFNFIESNSFKVLVAGDKFMSKMHLKQPGFTVLVVHSRGTEKGFKKLYK